VQRKATQKHSNLDFMEACSFFETTLFSCLKFCRRLLFCISIVIHFTSMFLKASIPLKHQISQVIIHESTCINRVNLQRFIASEEESLGHQNFLA
jgi:hypothetical protein